MKRLVFLAIIFMVAAMFWVCTASAKTVRIKKEQGGTLGHVAVGCAHRVTDWRTLKRINPKLPAPVEIQSGVYDVRVFQDDPVEVPDDWDCSKLDPRLGVVEPEPTPKESPSSEGRTLPLVPEEPRVETAPGTGESLWAMSDWLLGLLIILVVVLVILWLAGVFRNLPPIILSRWRNPARYPAVVIGGLSEDPRTALGQVEAAYSGLTAQARCAECGYFEKTDDSAPDWVLAKMATGDRTERRVYVRPGQRIFRLMIGGTVIWYSLMECGNALRITPPRGWRFVVGQAVNIARPAPTGAATGTGTGAGTGAASAGTGVGIGTGAGTDTGTKPEPQAADAGTKEESAAKEEPPTTEEAPIAEAEETAKQTLTSNEVEVTIGDLLIKVATGNGHMPATKIRTGDGTEVTLQQL